MQLPNVPFDYMSSIDPSAQEGSDHMVPKNNALTEKLSEYMLTERASE